VVPSELDRLSRFSPFEAVLLRYCEAVSPTGVLYEMLGPTYFVQHEPIAACWKWLCFGAAHCLEAVSAASGQVHMIFAMFGVRNCVIFA
jgi:hypothetical protein